MAEWFGSDWASIGFVVASTVAMYVTMVVAVRIAGRRTVAQLSAFDVLVTVALGTLLSSTVVAPDPSYSRATTAVVVLLGLQVGLAALRRRSRFVERALTFRPEVVVRAGEVQLPAGLGTSQLSERELLSRLRQAGVFDLDGVAIVVLEPSGSISVSRDDPGPVV